MYMHHIDIEDGKDQESIQSSTTPDPVYYFGKGQKHKKTPHKGGQVASPFPVGDNTPQWTHKTAWQTRNINNKKDPQIKHERNFIKLPFIYKGMEFIDLHSIFKDNQWFPMFQMTWIIRKLLSFAIDITK